MINKCIVGYSGFVGGNLLLDNEFDKLYNSKNFKDAKNTEINIMYFCGIPAIKWYANNNPEKDDETITNIINILNTIKINKFILISTIDVYENINGDFDENYICNYSINHTYGKNRYLFEKYISEKFNDYHIIRLPALFGYGLKKNILYDLLNNNNINKISINTKFQWYNLDWLNNDINYIINNNIKICNLFTEPLETINIIKLFDYNLNLFEQNSYLTYDLKTKFYSNKYYCSKDRVYYDIIKFINYQKLNKNNLCISNICSNNMIQFSTILNILGIKNVEIAPTKLIDWDNLDNINFDEFISKDINIYSFQSITYTLDNLNIFTDSRDKLLEHLKRVIDIAIKNNLKIIVFGCPKNRKFINNEKPAIEFFRELGNYCNDIKICIEPNSKKYNCNYINNIEESIELVKKINHPNIRSMIDLGNAIMENDKKIYELFDSEYIHHIHISQEYLGDFFNPHEENYKFSNFIKNKYNKIITLEMLLNNYSKFKQSLINFIHLYSS